MFCSSIGNLRLCTNVGDQVDLLKDDMHSLGVVFAFSITQGLQVFQKDGTYNQTAVTILKKFPRAHQFFKNCVKNPLRDR